MAAENQPQPESAENDADALESPEGGAEQTAGASSADDGVIDASSSKAAPPTKPGGLKGFLRRFNIYLLLFVFILLIAGALVLVAYFQGKKGSGPATVKTQTLTQNTLQQLANSDATVGNDQQVLNVQSSAVFAGKVLMRQDLELAGNLQIGGTVGLNDLTVTGTTQLGQAQINKNLSVAGDTAVQGATTIAKSLQVNGGGSFSGPITAPQITTSTLQLNGDLTLTHHIVIGGGTPGRSPGPALGGGGTASVSGSDTAGTVSINTGNSPAAGCFITVNFAQKFNTTPRVLLTPVGSAGGGLAYYVNRSSTSFSICDAAPPPAGSSFGFDYFIAG